MEKLETFKEPGDTASTAQQQNHRSGQNRSAGDRLLLHGLSVERYREIYNSVLDPSVLSALSSASNTDYVCQVLELKQNLWTRLSRPRLQEMVMEDGRVEVTEILDLT